MSNESVSPCSCFDRLHVSLFSMLAVFSVLSLVVLVSSLYIRVSFSMLVGNYSGENAMFEGKSRSTYQLDLQRHW
jgi:hypothetical protein